MILFDFVAAIGLPELNQRGKRGLKAILLVDFSEMREREDEHKGKDEDNEEIKADKGMATGF